MLEERYEADQTSVIEKQLNFYWMWRGFEEKDSLSHREVGNKSMMKRKQRWMTGCGKVAGSWGGPSAVVVFDKACV